MDVEYPSKRRDVNFNSSAITAMKSRYTCRMYQGKTIEPGLRASLIQSLDDNKLGPLGTKARFEIIAASEGDVSSLKGLGTYGLIKGANGFIVGATESGPKSLEDFGYLMECAILRATELGLGTCWLGGVFTKSNFAKRIQLTDGEIMPAIVVVGYREEGSKERDKVRKGAGADHRLPREALFFEGDFNKPIKDEASGPYREVLDLVRWAPSASNKQPWRIVKTETGWHFCLARSKHYGKGSLLFTLLRIPDLQRVDMGIAMCHFELSAQELGLKGSWVVEDPALPLPDKTEYVVTWRPKV